MSDDNFETRITAAEKAICTELLQIAVAAADNSRLDQYVYDALTHMVDNIRCACAIARDYSRRPSEEGV